MQSYDFITSAIESLEKEVWHIVKKALPALKEEILALIGGGKIEEAIRKIEEMQSVISSLSARLQNVENSVSTNTTAIEENKNSINSLSATLTSLSSQLSEAKTQLSNTTSLVSTHSGQISSINTKISSLENQIAGMDNSALRADVDKNTGDIFIVATHVKENMGKISTLTTAVEELKTKLKNIEEYDLLYDMDSTDENINHGFTSGIGGTKMLKFDMNSYKFVRVFALVNNQQGILDLYIDNRKKTDYNLISANMFGTAITIYKISIVPSNSAVQPGYTTIYTWSNTNSAFEQTYRKISDEKAYIYRVEGFRK